VAVLFCTGKERIAGLRVLDYFHKIPLMSVSRIRGGESVATLGVQRDAAGCPALIRKKSVQVGNTKNDPSQP